LAFNKLKLKLAFLYKIGHQ